MGLGRSRLGLGKDCGVGDSHGVGTVLSALFVVEVDVDAVLPGAGTWLPPDVEKAVVVAGDGESYVEVEAGDGLRCVEVVDPGAGPS
mmetsp:Transcript_32976/g.48366  ORF Transcript_32976/g.48366 Transcript_32976/m.48366 type:complete len:87 (+) Transcript_32976:1890-2150(+)